MTIGVRLVVSCLTALSAQAAAEPWARPGDAQLRRDITLLADAGIIRGPVTTWPLSWPDVSRDVLGATGRYDAETEAALLRVQRRARTASARGVDSVGLRVTAAYEPGRLRSFGEEPLDEVELSIRASWLSDHAAVHLQGTAVADPDDGKNIRADGSYVGVNVGNFMISAGWHQRWWGPGWEGSLILSTNARPIPSLTVERNYTDPFKSKLLSWLGPWRASIAVGEAEGRDVPVPNVRFMAARVNFRPKPWLEVGLTRTAQWCGSGRQCDWGVFTDMLLGQDNQVNEDGTADQPGNQMAGYDLRLRSPWRRLPLAAYTQWIGEDEAGGLPSKFLGLAGLETWGGSPWGGYQLHAEFADTTCAFTRQQSQYDCAYRNGIYPQGYAYRGRIIGHSMDNDSRMYSLGASLTRVDGSFMSVLLRRIELNRDGGDHAITDVPANINNVELRVSRPLGSGNINMGAGYFDDPQALAAGSSVHGYVTWQQGF